VSNKTDQLKQVLERLYQKYNRRELIKPDPLQFVYRYDNQADREIAALLASALTYGRVLQIEKNLDRLLALTGDSPFEFVLDFNETKAKQLKDFKHRFTTGQDICELLFLLKKILRQYGCIESFFIRFYNPDDKNVIPVLTGFCDSIYDMYAEDHNGKVGRGLKYLLPNPANGSACKRLNLFLRWMVRRDEVDLGLWQSVDKSGLLVPMDVHMGRLSRILGFHNRKTISLSAAVETTNAFLKIEPADPVKYDFALSRVGIVENCIGRRHSKCEMCDLLEFCSLN